MSVNETGAERQSEVIDVNDILLPSPITPLPDMGDLRVPEFSQEERTILLEGNDFSEPEDEANELNQTPFTNRTSLT